MRAFQACRCRCNVCKRVDTVHRLWHRSFSVQHINVLSPCIVSSFERLCALSAVLVLDFSCPLLCRFILTWRRKRLQGCDSMTVLSVPQQPSQLGSRVDEEACRNWHCRYAANSEGGYLTCCAMCEFGKHTVQCTERRRCKAPPPRDRGTKPAEFCTNEDCQLLANVYGGFTTCCGRCFDNWHTLECHARQNCMRGAAYNFPPRVCTNENCELLANPGHTTCCGACGEEWHTNDCNVRQNRMAASRSRGSRARRFLMPMPCRNKGCRNFEEDPDGFHTRVCATRQQGNAHYLIPDASENNEWNLVPWLCLSS